MKFIRVLASLFLVLLVCSASTPKSKSNKNGLYMVGVSASFTDSLIYFTDVQFVDSVELDKDGYLPLREQYSDQLDNYLEMKIGLKNRTCFIYFNKKKDKLEKNINKMKAKYQKEGKGVLRDTGDDFKFNKVNPY